MYGLPKNVDLTFLLRKKILQVCIGFNEIIFHFDEDRVSICIQSTCAYQSEDGTVVQIENYPISASTLCKVLGEPIIQVHGEESGALKLKFSNGSTLTIYDDDKQYESYQIKHGDKVIVV